MTLFEDAVLAPAPGTPWESLPLPRGCAPGAPLSEFLAAESDRDAALGTWLELDAAGRLELRLGTGDPALARLYGSPAAPAPEPGLRYVRTYESRWAGSRELYDFVGRRDYVGRLKALERDLYLERLEPWLSRLRLGQRALDAGCGVGRFLLPLLARGLRVDGLDASAAALKAAARHALAAGAGARLSLRLGDARRLPYADASFDAALALELVCYHPDAQASLRELSRVLKPGGLLFVSVEGLHGSLLKDRELDSARLAALLASRERRDEELYVRYFEEAELAAELEAAGFCMEATAGTHYVLEGVLDQLATEEALERRPQELLALERSCSEDPALRPLARAWLAVARKEGV